MKLTIHTAAVEVCLLLEASNILIALWTGKPSDKQTESGSFQIFINNTMMGNGLCQSHWANRCLVFGHMSFLRVSVRVFLDEIII